MDAEEELNVSQSLNRKLRLKALFNEVQHLDQDLTNYGAEAALKSISEIIAQSDEIINEGEVKDRAQHTTEVVMDAHVLKINHELVSKILLDNMEFNEKSYLNSIKGVVYQTGMPDWNAFAELVCKSARTAHLQSTMLGAVEVELKKPVQKERQKHSRNPLAKEKRPENVRKLKRQDKGAQKVNMVLRQLIDIFKRNKCETMPFYKLIIDPHNFMNSVENAFQMAFLARDGIIGILKGEDGYPCIRLVQSAENKIQMDTSQWIFSLDMNTCEKMARLYKIKHPLIKVQLDELSDEDDEEQDMDTD